jgi:hypothetical protein
MDWRSAKTSAARRAERDASGVDRRCVCYFVPAHFCVAPGVLDFGGCLVRLQHG